MAASNEIWNDVTKRFGFADAFEKIHEVAVQRDADRQLLLEEAALLKTLNFGALRLPVKDGGHGATLPELFLVTRDLAIADSNLSHSLRNHFGSVERHLRTVGETDSSAVLRIVASGKLLGGAHSERDTEGPAGTMGGRATRFRRDDARDGFILSGKKSYSTGNVYSDHIFVTAFDEEAGTHRQALIPSARKGIDIADDWDGFGQKLTGSGTTFFNDVKVAASEFLDASAGPRQPPGFYEFTFQQVYLTNVISGILLRIFSDAKALTKARSRNYYHAVAERVQDEPAVQGVVGRIGSYSHAIAAVVDRAVGKLDEARAYRDDTDENVARAKSLEASITAAEAKIVTDEIAGQLANQLMDLASGSSVSTSKGLDRHWRNIKVLSSHNPRIYKEQIVGKYHLTGAVPPTGPYF